MRILGIETSCDETAIAVIEADGGLAAPQFKLLGSALFSQIEIHKEFGGVFPNLAKREHAKNLVPLLEKTLRESGLLIKKEEERFSSGRSRSPRGWVERENVSSSFSDHIKTILERELGLFEQFEELISRIEKPAIDAIAVTEGPGLEPALWVGISFATALSKVWDLPLIPTNHMEGHIVSPLLSEKPAINDINESTTPHVTFPVLALLISGGHTELVYSEKWGSYKILGGTKDDAVGEAFDKVARMMDLPYPGGPEISLLAEKARTESIDSLDVYRKTAGEMKTSTPAVLPRPMIHSGDFNFSFSGLKTAVLYLIKKIGLLSDDHKKDIAREFEDAVIEVLVSKTRKALHEHAAATFIIGGGVIANKAIRHALTSLQDEFPDLQILLPSRDLSTDNAIMIAMAAYIRYVISPELFTTKDPRALRARGNLSLE